MSKEFSTRLSLLRKEKKISQKTAAEALDVSQALLSHYEKGIRECGLDFIKRACEYYEVSADYLLGLTGKRHGIGGSDAPEKDDTAGILRRSAIKICEQSGISGNEMGYCFNRIGPLAAYRAVVTLASHGQADRERLERALEAQEFLAAFTANPFKSADIELPGGGETLKALIEGCEDFVRQNAGNEAKNN